MPRESRFGGRDYLIGALGVLSPSGRGTLPLRRELTRLGTETSHGVGSTSQITGQLTDTTTKLDAGRQFFLTALGLLRNPQAFYRGGGHSVKHALTKVIFSKLYLDMQDTTLVNNHDLTPGISGLIEAEAPPTGAATLSAIGKTTAGTSRAGTAAGPSWRRGLRSTIFLMPIYSAGP